MTTASPAYFLSPPKYTPAELLLLATPLTFLVSDVATFPFNRIPAPDQVTSPGWLNIYPSGLRKGSLFFCSPM